MASNWFGETFSGRIKSQLKVLISITEEVCWNFHSRTLMRSARIRRKIENTKERHRMSSIITFRVSSDSPCSCAKLKILIIVMFLYWNYLQFNYLTAPANNLNVNLVHHQQKAFVSHPYSEHYYYESSNNNNRTYNSSTPNSTIKSVKNYRKPHPPVGAALQVVPTSANYNVVMNTSSSNTSYQATNPLTNNLNHSYNNNTNSYKYSQNNNLNHSNISYPSKVDPNNTSNLSRRSSQSSSSHEWMSEKPHSLSLCINRINLKKSNKSDSSGAQFQSMRCRKHRNRNHFFNTSTSTSYQKYKLTKSCSNDTVNSDQPPDVEKNPQTTYKFI